MIYFSQSIHNIHYCPGQGWQPVQGNKWITCRRKGIILGTHWNGGLTNPQKTFSLSCPPSPHHPLFLLSSSSGIKNAVFINIDDLSTSLLRKVFPNLNSQEYITIWIFLVNIFQIFWLWIFLQKKAKQVADKTQASTKFKQLGDWGFFCTGSLTQVKNIHPVCMIKKKRNQWTKSLHFQNNTPEKLIDFLTTVDWIFQT